MRAISSGSCVPSMLSNDDIISAFVVFWLEAAMLAKLTTLTVSNDSECGGES